MERMVRIPANTRGTTGRNISTQKKDTTAQEPEWISRLEEWGTEKEKEDLTYTYKKRERYSAKRDS